MSLCNWMNCNMPSFPILHYFQSLLEPTPIMTVTPSNHLILCHPLLLLPSIFPRIRVFPKSWLFAPGGQSIGASALVSVLPGNIQDWFPLVLTDLISVVQGTLKSLLQHHSSKPSILRHSALFIVQFLYPYMTTGKVIGLITPTFVGKGMSL